MTAVERRKYNNGKRYSPDIKYEARQLRSNGFTHREISKRLAISAGTAHLWTKDIKLTKEQKQELHIRCRIGIHNWSEEEKKKIAKRLAPYPKDLSDKNLSEKLERVIN